MILTLGAFSRPTYLNLPDPHNTFGIPLNRQELGKMDLHVFKKAQFSEIKTLSDLIQLTNVLNDTELDLDTSAKKIQFCLSECSQRMKSIATEKHNELIQNLHKVDSCSDLVLQQIAPVASRIEQAYQRIESEIVTPYDEAVKLQGAIKMIHSTLLLLRGAGFFLVFVQQLQEYEALYESSEDPKTALKLAKLLKQVQLVYSNDVFWTGSGVRLTSLELIRGYRLIVEEKTAKFVSDLKTDISHAFGHHTSFNEENLILQSNLLALLELDKELVFLILDEVIVKSTQVALSLLSRSLQSQRNLQMNFTDVNLSSSSFVAKLCGLLRNCRVNAPNQASESLTLIDLFEVYLSQMDQNSIENFYWFKLAQLYKRNILSTLAKGGPIARNLQNNREQVSEAIRDSFSIPAGKYLLDAVSILNKS